MSSVRFTYETSLCLKCGASQSTVLVKFGDLYKARKLVDCCDGYFNIHLDDGSVFDGVLGEIFENVCGKVPVEKADETGVLVEEPNDNVTDEPEPLDVVDMDDVEYGDDVSEVSLNCKDNDMDLGSTVSAIDVGEVSLDDDDVGEVLLDDDDVGEVSLDDDDVDKVCRDGIDVNDSDLSQSHQSGYGILDGIDVDNSATLSLNGFNVDEA